MLLAAMFTFWFLSIPALMIGEFLAWSARRRSLNVQQNYDELSAMRAASHNFSKQGGRDMTEELTQEERITQFKKENPEFSFMMDDDYIPNESDMLAFSIHCAKQKERLEEQADIAAIAANPISNWMWSNGKIILIVLFLLTIFMIMNS